MYKQKHTHERTSQWVHLAQVTGNGQFHLTALPNSNVFGICKLAASNWCRRCAKHTLAARHAAAG